MLIFLTGIHTHAISGFTVRLSTRWQLIDANNQQTQSNSEEITIFNRLSQFFGSQNFALINTNLPDVTILRNQVDGHSIFCVLINNTNRTICSASQLHAINAKLTEDNGQPLLYARPSNILFLVVTGDVSRDKGLSTIGLNLWLASTQTDSLMIFEDQIDDFYGLRCGIENAIRGEYSDGMFEIKKKKNRSFSNKTFPYVTIALIVLNVTYFLILAFNGYLNSSTRMLRMGANFAPFVFDNFQIWRLVTSMFMHFSLAHLGSNMLYLAIAGYNLERGIGHLRFLLIYMLSGIGGNLISSAFHQIRGSYVVSAGASGAIYGLIGAIALLTFMNYRYMRRTYIIYRVGILLIFVFYSSFVSSGIDGAAHIGGFFFGILLTFLFSTRRKKA